jgi:hypothetical protein
MLATGANIVASAQAVAGGGVFKKPELTFLVAAVVKSGLVSHWQIQTIILTIYVLQMPAFIAAGFLRTAVFAAPVGTTLQA